MTLCVEECASFSRSWSRRFSVSFAALEEDGTLSALVSLKYPSVASSLLIVIDFSTLESHSLPVGITLALVTTCTRLAAGKLNSDFAA
jgi:hypothetical protein